MPISDRDYIRGEHPSACTCKECSDRRLARLKKANKSFIKLSLKRRGTDDNKKPPKSNRSKISHWVTSLLLLFALSTIGLGLSLISNNFTLLWILLGFSIIFSIEKWFYSTLCTSKYKKIGKLYRLLLNLCLLALFGIITYSGIKLFSQQLVHSSLVDSLVFIIQLSSFIWLWRVTHRNTWRFPSMKLTIFTLITLAAIFAFAGVQPFAGYKDSLVKKWETYQAEKVAEQQIQQAELERIEAAKLKAKQEAEAQIAEAIRQEQLQAEQIRKEAEEEAARIASLRNPSWAELKAFLLKDDTDKMEYVYPIVVCADFADKLKRNAEEVGWRCGVAQLSMTGYTDPYNYGIAHDAGHACNAFETTDRGLVYIDCTAAIEGPLHQDRIVNIQIGEQYNPKHIFPSSRWSEVPSGQMGIVIGIDIQW